MLRFLVVRTRRHGRKLADRELQRQEHSIYDSLECCLWPDPCWDSHVATALSRDHGHDLASVQVALRRDRFQMLCI